MSSLDLDQPRGWSGALREKPIQYAIGFLTLILVSAPILPILYQSVIDRALYDDGQQWTLANYARLFGSDGFGRVIGNTLLLAAGTTVIAQGIGTAAAIFLGRADIPGRRVLGEIFLWPLYLSSLILCFAWASVYGPSGYITPTFQHLVGFRPWNLYSLPGMMVVAGVSLAPLAFIYSLSAATMTDPSFEEAARIAGASRRRTLWHVTMPLLKPSIFYSALLITTGGLELLSIPLIFGEPAGIIVLSTFLYKNGASAAVPNYGLLATSSVFLLLLICAMIALQARVLGSLRKYETVGGKATRPKLLDLGRWRWVCFAVFALYLTAAVLVPIGMLVVRAFVSFLHPLVPLNEVATLDNFRALLEFPTYRRSIWNSFFIAAVGGAMASVFVLSLAIVVHRSDFRFRKPLRYLALFPRAIPGLVAGIGFFYAVAMIPGLGAIRSTIWILVIAFTMANLPLAYGTVAPMLTKISPELDRAARVQGADWWLATTKIIVPIMKPAFIACFTILFIVFFKEYTTAVFLYAPGSEVIGTTLLSFWTQGHIASTAALATVQIAVIGICVAVARLALGVRIYG